MYYTIDFDIFLVNGIGLIDVDFRRLITYVFIYTPFAQAKQLQPESLLVYTGCHYTFFVNGNIYYMISSSVSIESSNYIGDSIIRL